MAVRRVLLAGNPILNKKAENIADFSSQHLRTLIEDLRDTLTDFRERKGLGRGIAAPQIGASERAVYIIEEGEHVILINPVIEKYSEEKMKVWDTCFSYDASFFVLVERAKAVEVSYQTLDEDRKTIKASMEFADILQHEIDHLDGRLSFMRALNPPSIMMHHEWLAASKPYILD